MSRGEGRTLIINRLDVRKLIQGIFQGFERFGFNRIIILKRRHIFLIKLWKNRLIISPDPSDVGLMTVIKLINNKDMNRKGMSPSVFLKVGLLVSTFLYFVNKPGSLKSRKRCMKRPFLSCAGGDSPPEQCVFVAVGPPAEYATHFHSSSLAVLF